MMLRMVNLGALTAIACTPACSGEVEAPKPLIRPVRYQVVYSSGGARTRKFPGTAQAGIEARLSFKVAGTVTAVRVRVGDRVDKGTLIAELDPSDFLLQVEEAEARLEQARAGERNAAAVYARTRSLYETRSVSKSDLDAARASAETAEASVRSAEKALALTRRQYAYSRLRAPRAGAVAEVLVEPNENVSSGTPIVMLTSGSQLEVNVGVPEVLIGGIRKGAEVKVRFDALRGATFPGQVYEVGVAPVGASATFPVTVLLQKQDDRIRSGMATEVEFRFASNRQEDYFVVPAFSVREDRKGRFVFVVSAKDEGLGEIERRDVETGALSEDGIEVLKGLREGELLVTAGVSRIQHGQVVRVLPQQQM